MHAELPCREDPRNTSCKIYLECEPQQCRRSVVSHSTNCCSLKDKGLSDTGGLERGLVCFDGKRHGLLLLRASTPGNTVTPKCALSRHGELKALSVANGGASFVVLSIRHPHLACATGGHVKSEALPVEDDVGKIRRTLPSRSTSAVGRKSEQWRRQRRRPGIPARSWPAFGTAPTRKDAPRKQRTGHTPDQHSPDDSRLGQEDKQTHTLAQRQPPGSSSTATIPQNTLL